jgi:DNA polymerase-3 subunit alpha
VLPVGARELEIILPGRYDVSPSQAGQLSTVPGVLEVLEI